MSLVEEHSCRAEEGFRDHLYSRVSVLVRGVQCKLVPAASVTLRSRLRSGPGGEAVLIICVRKK